MTAVKESLLIGGPIQENKQKVQTADPITYVTKDDPPFLIMHGSDDPVVPVEQSIGFDAALRALGVDSTLRIIDGAGHGFPRAELTPVKPFFDRVLLLLQES